MKLIALIGADYDMNRIKEEQKMLFGFNGATSMKYDLETDLQIAHKAGFQLLEIWAEKLKTYLQKNTVDSLKKKLEKAGVKPYSINSIEFITFKRDREYEKIQRECQSLCQIAQQLSCPKIVVVPSPTPEGVDEAEITAESVRVLRDLSDIAGEYGVDLAFEFLGFSHISVNKLKHCYEIVCQTDRSNVGLVLDTFHFYAGDSKLESIEMLDRNKLFIFHINDAEDRPKNQLEDAHRLFPGEGVIPLEDILGKLKMIGYDKMVSIELFRPEYWELNPDELGARAMRSMEKVLNKVK